MVNAMNSVAFGNGISFRAAKPTASDVAKIVNELGIDMKDAQNKLRDARMSGYKLDSLEQIREVVQGKFKNCILPGAADIKPGTGFDTVSYMENNHNGAYQQYSAGKDKSHRPGSSNDNLDIYG